MSKIQNKIYAYMNNRVLFFLFEILTTVAVCVVLSVLLVVGSTSGDGIDPLIIILIFGIIVVGVGIFISFDVLHRILLATIFLDTAFQIDSHLWWDDIYGEFGTLAGLNVSLTTLALVGLYSLWLMESLIERKTPDRRPFFGINYPFIPYIMVLLLSIFVATEQRFVWFEFGLLIQKLFLVIYLAGAIRTREDVVFIYTIFATAILLEGFYLIFQRVSGDVFVSPNAEVYDVRVTGHFGSPNVAGSYFSVMLTVITPVIVNNMIPRLIRLLSAVAFLFGSIALLLTLSRGGWLAFIIGITIFVSAMIYRGWLSISFPSLLAILVMTILVVFPNLILARLFGGDNGAAEGRLPLNSLAFDMIEDNFWLGIGANNFAVAAPDYWGPQYNREWFYTVHNKYLLILSEIGVFGLLSFIFLLVTLSIRAWRVWLLKDPFLSPIGLAIAAAILGHATHLQVDIFNGHTSVQMLWSLGAIATALLLMGKKVTNNNAT